ncbi:MAG: hypothetical protein CSA62_14935 [Planctomycetota bacterium]|nr:MAG: hypothetical protein CSA62_14935 [Planctomycetota bacterium]
MLSKLPITLLTASFLACWAAPGARAQGQDQAQNLKAQQSQYKRKVDHSIKRLAEQKLETGLQAAKYLVALTHCHRQYSPADGPVVRPAVQLIFRSRNSNGLFGPADDHGLQRLTSAWAYQALNDFDGESYAADLAKTRAAFAKTYGLSESALRLELEPFARGHYGHAKNEIDSQLHELLAAIKIYRRIGAQIAATKKPDAAAKSKALPWAPFEQKALDWLLLSQKNGIWLVPTPDGKQVPDVGTSCLGLTALASKPAKLRSPAEQKILEQGITWLKSQQRKDGSFSEFTPNYVCSAAVMAIVASGAPNSQAALKAAQRYLLMIQNVERRGYQPSDRDYGSIGYGGDRRGDISNTQFALEALRLTGLDSKDEAFQKALVYLRRSQNLPGKGSYTGTMRASDGSKKTVRAGEDGGAQYYPGVSPAGYDESADGSVIPRSYGSMTYALLKCYILAGLSKDDPRLQAALNWTKKHFTVEYNPGSKPGLPEKTKFQGLYYYYLTMARAYHFGGIDKVADKDWRKTLRKHLESQQKPGGFWVNDKNGRWYEQSPIVCTAYTLIALRQ